MASGTKRSATRALTPRGAVAFVRRHGVVLASARGPVPSVAEAVAGEPIRGSWWGHRRGQAIFAALSGIARSREILVCRLVSGKITFVHRRVWPALVRLAARFPRERLAWVRQEHTPAGYHVNRIEPFPEWVPRAVLAEAQRWTDERAQAMLLAIPQAGRGSRR